MGLDKWLEPEDDVKKKNKKTQYLIQAKKSKSEDSQKEILGKQGIKLTKYTLVCPNTKCKYQKKIMKKQLNEIDRKCPRCNKEMKIK